MPHERFHVQVRDGEGNLVEERSFRKRRRALAFMESVVREGGREAIMRLHSGNSQQHHGGQFRNRPPFMRCCQA